MVKELFYRYNKDEMMNELGFREKVIINLLSEEGHKVKTSINKYDFQKIYWRMKKK